VELGFDVSERTVSRYILRHPKPLSQTWRTFLENHVSWLASMDLFVVPTAAFRLLYGFIILRHDRRRIVHFGVTEHPTSIWIAQQITEAFPWGTAPRYLIRDRDGVYGKAARERLAGREITEVRTAPRLHWKSPHVEWVIGSIRRECLDPGIRAGLLPSLPMSLVARKGCARWTTRAAGRQWRDRGVAASQRAPSPTMHPGVVLLRFSSGYLIANLAIKETDHGTTIR
jgi:hypothetical protein